MNKVHIPRHSWLPIVGILSLFLVGYEAYSAVLAVESREWRSAPGSIAESTLEKRFRRGKQSRSVEFYYEYRVDGKSYVGSRVNFGGVLNKIYFFGMQVGGVLDKYPEGKHVTVYYDPDDPQNCVLEREFPMSAAIALGVGVTVLIASAGFGLLAVFE